MTCLYTLFIVLATVLAEPDTYETPEEVYSIGLELYEQRDLDGAKKYITNVIRRCVNDSTRNALDLECRIQMAHIQEQRGELKSAWNWLMSIYKREEKRPYVIYPEGWRKRMKEEMIQCNYLIGLEKKHQQTQWSTAIIALTVSVVLMMVFIYLYILKSVSYRRLAASARAWAEASRGNAREDGNAALAARIREHLETSQCYLDPGLKMDDIVSAIGSNRTYVSKAINSVAANFNALVNEYRVKEAVRLISNKSQSSLEEISINCGFNSRKSFNEAFKAFTGLSPAEFRNNI